MVLLKWLEPKTVFSNIYIIDRKKTIFTKASGCYSIHINISHENNYSRFTLASGVVKILYNYNFVTLGRNSNIHASSITIGKAGINVKLGFKSSVRGVAMNPVDHPHGGRTKTNSPQRTPWGKIAKKNK